MKSQKGFTLVELMVSLAALFFNCISYYCFNNSSSSFLVDINLID